jgi:uncharacterized surface protein with fasciclin (FAS1) repeats
MSKLKKASLVALAAALVLAGCNCTYCMTSGDQSKDIVSTAVEAGSFKTLVTALKAADLDGALSGEGPFTVFAPTDEAFAKLPAGTVEELLKPESLNKLKAILTYHVVPGRLTANDVISRTGAETLSGKSVSFSHSGDHVRVGDAVVTKADILCSNGVIHVIDSVLLP